MGRLSRGLHDRQRGWGTCWCRASSTRTPRTSFTSRFGADLPFLGEARATDELLAEVTSRRGVAVLAHPDRREAWRALDRDALCSLVGIEVWNRKYDGWAPSSVAIRLCEKESGLIPFFGLDFHTRRQLFPLAMIVDAEQPGTAESVVNSLLARRCHPTAFGVRGARLTQGAGLTAARSAEASRRFVRPVVRRWRRLRGRQRG